MKKISRCVALVAALSCSALAEYTFAGLEWGLTPAQTLKSLTAKGYEIEEELEDAGAVDLEFSGSISNASAVFVARFSLSGELQNITIVSEEISNPCQMYQILVKSLAEKYGDIEDEQDKRSPQFEDISSCTQLSQGIRLGEVYWSHSWSDDETGLVIETLKGGQIRIDYYGPKWDQEYNRREEGKVDDL